MTKTCAWHWLRLLKTHHAKGSKDPSARCRTSIRPSLQTFAPDAMKRRRPLADALAATPHRCLQTTEPGISRRLPPAFDHEMAQVARQARGDGCVASRPWRSTRDQGRHRHEEDGASSKTPLCFDCSRLRVKAQRSCMTPSFQILRTAWAMQKDLTTEHLVSEVVRRATRNRRPKQPLHQATPTTALAVGHR